MQKLSLVLRLVAAVILLQTLYFKFSGAPESVWIFSQLGAEPWGRIGSGVAELICAALLLMPRTAWLGAAGAAGIMFGAVASHLAVLGIEVQDDGGQLFALALVVLLCSAVVLWLEKANWLPLVQRFGMK